MRELPVIQEHASCVSRVPIFRGLSPDDQQVVAALARPVTLDAGQHLFESGDAVGTVFVVHVGRLKVVRVSASGREHLARVVGPGEVVGEHAFLTGERPEHRVEAMAEARLCTFGHADLAGLVGAHPTIALAMLRSAAQRLEDAERRLALGAADVPARVADYLLGLPAHRGVVRWPMPKKEVAAFLATTPESLSRALARLEADGLIRSTGGTVALLDAMALEDRAAR